jgi:twinkle protein
MIVRLDKQIIDRVEWLIDNPNKIVYSLDIPELDPFYKIVLGSTTYIGGTPGHGKSEFLFEMLIRLSEKYSFKHLIFTPESGFAEDIYLELACKYLGKSNRPNAFNRITKTDFYNTIGFITEHFIVREVEDKTPSPTSLMQEITECIYENEIKTVTIDPWNELLHNFSEFNDGGRQDVYLEIALSNVRAFARKHKLHFFVVAHPRTLQKNKEGKYDPPTAYELSGGGTWFAKADSILCVHRPLEHSDTHFERTFVDIHVQKAKPKSVGMKGTAEIDYDWVTGRYKSREGSKQIVTPF